MEPSRQAKAVRKVKRPSAVEQSQPALSPGDSVEFSLTAEVKHPRKGSFWIKGGGTTQIRPGEKPEAARKRLHSFVIDSVDEQVREVLS